MYLSPLRRGTIVFFVCRGMWLLRNVLLFGTLTAVNAASLGQKSRDKCKEYAKLVYADEDVPVLRMGGGSNTISHCGVVETPLIIGGVKAKPKEFPHMAVIGFGTDETNVAWHCGGTVISEEYILTAAHCLDSRDKGPAIKVRVGLTNLRSPEETMQERGVADRIKHPKYQLPAKYHDIALIKLDRPLQLNPNVRPACLEAESATTGGKAIACGFGKTAYDGGGGSDDLMKVQLNYISDDECKNNFKAEFGGKQMPDGLIANQLCAGVLEGGKDTCQGDSGGPLQRVMKDPYCTYSVVGVTSFGKFCGFKNSPAIYSKVNSYLDWIENIVWP